ncbi:hypothetical protein LCGC14_3067220 [marine sediment metagenome]|uniref:Uncharacterized protein n=1 Tax=marine sediment metagenome TaxID=412755 RepID=A0A0F8X5F1_9ZZZZ
MSDERASVPFGDDTSLDDAVPKQSKYLSKEDCDPAILVQIAYLAQDEIRVDNDAVESRGVLYFNGDIKPLILNPTNRDILKAILGVTSAGQLKNQQIVLYNDLTVVFRGKVGGIRIRSAQQEAAPVSHIPDQGSQAQDFPPQDFDDDIPFP